MELLLFKGLGYPMQGSWLVLTAGLGLASAACVTMGAFFYAIIRDPARASLAGAYTAPGFAFMGVTFPVSAMGMWPSSGAACCPSPTMWSCRSGKPTMVNR